MTDDTDRLAQIRARVEAATNDRQYTTGKYSTGEKCESCGGSGHFLNEACPDCFGTGLIWHLVKEPSDRADVSYLLDLVDSLTAERDAALARCDEELARFRDAADMLGWLIYSSQPDDLEGYSKSDHAPDSPLFNVYRQTSLARGTARNAAKFVWWTLGSVEFPRTVDPNASLEDILAQLGETWGTKSEHWAEIRAAQQGQPGRRGKMSDDARALRARIDEAVALLRAQQAVITRQGWEDSSSETVLEVLEVLSDA